jgi:hypothetical protein
VLEDGGNPDVARVLTRERHVAHGSSAARGRLGGREAVRLERGLQPGAMLFDLGGEVFVVAAGLQPERGAAKEAIQNSHRPIVRRWEAWIG